VTFCTLVTTIANVQPVPDLPPGGIRQARQLIRQRVAVAEHTRSPAGILGATGDAAKPIVRVAGGAYAAAHGSQSALEIAGARAIVVVDEGDQRRRHGRSHHRIALGQQTVEVVIGRGDRRAAGLSLRPVAGLPLSGLADALR
jgi:hypothetical protein